MKKSIACCYLTYCHPEVIDQILGIICELYSAHGIDLYIYDSSPDNKTENIVDKYREKYPDTLFYVDVRHIDTADEKYLYVIRGNGLRKKYDYIWPTKDRCFFMGQTLDKICEEIQKGYDVVFAACEDNRWELRTPPVKDVYTDGEEFFEHYGQLSTDWEALIRKTETMLEPIDWDEYSGKYNIGANQSFNQTITLFARLSEMENYQIRVIHHDLNDIRYSLLASSTWNDRLVEIWFRRWISAVFSLPEMYNRHKINIIHSQLNRPDLFGSVEALVLWKYKGILTAENMGELLGAWNMISDVPVKYVQMIFSDMEKDVYPEVVGELHTAFKNHEYDKAYIIFTTNSWLSQTMDGESFADLSIAFKVYKNEINTKGYSVLFEGTSSLEELLGRYREIK